MLFILLFKSYVDFMQRFWFHVNQINVFHRVSADYDSAGDDFEIEQDADDKGEELRNNIQDLFAPGKLTKSNLRELLESFSFPSEVGNEPAARSAPSSVAKASFKLTDGTQPSFIVHVFGNLAPYR